MSNTGIAEIHERIYAYLTEELKEQNLCFTLRQRNRAGRLNKGYWFSGNDNYLAISFWKGLDWRNKSSNIYFSVLANGNSSLNFVSYDEEKKIKFFEGLSEVLGMKQLTTKAGIGFEHWIKNYKGSDYIISLDTFLKQDKKIIDAFIKSSDEMREVFEPIDKEEFRSIKKRIDTVRKDIIKNRTFQTEYKEVKSIKLQELVVENISLFGTPQHISFNKNLTCLIGLNGTGKTSLLRALVLAFTGFEQTETMGSDDELLTDRLRNLMRITGVNKFGNPEYPKEGGVVEVSYKLEREAGIEDTVYKNRVLMTNDGGGPIVSDDSESDFINLIDDKYKCLFLAFPQIQGESKDPENGIVDVKYPHIKDALSMLNNQPDNRFGAFADWLRGLNNVANDKQAKGNLNPPERVLLGEIFSIMSEITGESISLHEIVVRDTGKDLIWVTLGKNTSPILFDLVSQGYNNIFGWIGYFIKRLVEVTPEGEQDYRKTPGIVLIDEIDTYLHPKWQAKILAVLVDRFPNVQFVVTTHSPYVVGSVPGDQTAIFTCKKEEQEVIVEKFDEFMPYGANIERLSEKVFGVKGRFVEEVDERLSKLSKLITNGELKEAKSFLENEFGIIDHNDPELERNKMLIRTKEILAQ